MQALAVFDFKFTFFYNLLHFEQGYFLNEPGMPDCVLFYSHPGSPPHGIYNF